MNEELLRAARAEFDRQQGSGMFDLDELTRVIAEHVAKHTVAIAEEVGNQYNPFDGTEAFIFGAVDSVANQIREAYDLPGGMELEEPY